MPDRIETLVDQMTLEEQVSLLAGETIWSTPAIARLGIGALHVTDGPNGARGGGSLIGGVKSAAFPVGIALGASFDTELVAEIGAAIAVETKSKGAHMLLGPTVNLHRSVTNGRNFECYSEDPLLSAELAAAYVGGLQGEGVAATVKHFVGNESEIERTTMSSEIGERALRELYLVPFEWAVKRGGTWGVMSSYNRLNGTFTSENFWLLTTVLRGEWGYDGIVMSDWFGSHSTAETVNAGLDLEMPGPTRDRGEKLVRAVREGQVAPAIIRARALAMLRLLERTGALDATGERVEVAEDRPEHRALIRRAGADAAVLLKNEGILPLDPARVGTVAVIGPNARVAQIMGGGSAQLNPHYRVSPYEGLTAAFGKDRLLFETGVTNHRWEPLLKGRFTVEYFNAPDLSGDVVHRDVHHDGELFLFGDVAAGKVDPERWSARFTTSFVPDATGEYRVGVAAAGHARVWIAGRVVADAWTNWTPGHTFFEEGCDEVVGTIRLEAGRTYEVELEFGKIEARSLGFSAFRLGIGLPLGDEAITAAAEAAQEADVALVFVGRNGEWDTEGSDLEDIRLPGRQDELVEAVAAANPRTVVVLQTGGPVEMPWLDRVQAVLQAWYPGQEAGNSIADVLTGAAEPGGRLPQTFPRRWVDNPTHSQDPVVYPGHDGKVRYEEGLFIGYRHYNKQGIAPLFPFGHGLSYTQFSLSEMAVDDSRFESDGRVTVSIEIENTGARAGSVVPQLYVLPIDPPVERPVMELKAFAKVRLAPGERRVVTLTLEDRAFAYYREQAQHWVVAPGRYGLMLGLSAAESPIRYEISRTTTLMLPV